MYPYVYPSMTPPCEGYGNPWQNYIEHCNYCSTCRQPKHLCQCQTAFTYMKLPQELLANDTTSIQEAFIGGMKNVTLTLEYVKPKGAVTPAPAVKVTISFQGESTEWSAIPADDDEYQIKETSSTVAPGSNIKLEVTNCTARLRWCECVSC